MAKPGLEQAADGVHEKLQTYLPADDGLELYSNGIGVTEQYLAKNPDVVRKFVRAALKGWKFALDNPAKAAQDEIKYIPSLKPEVIEAEIGVVRDLSVTPDVEQHGLGWFDPAKIKENVDFVVKYIGVKGTPPAPADLYATGYLPDAADQAVIKSAVSRSGRSPALTGIEKTGPAIGSNGRSVISRTSTRRSRGPARRRLPRSTPCLSIFMPASSSACWVQAAAARPLFCGSPPA